MSPQTLGEHLRVKRMEMKMQQQELAKLLGILPMTLSTWESNTNEPHPKYLEHIVQFLGYLPKLKPEVEKIGTRMKLWRMHHNVSKGEFLEMCGISEEERYKIEEQRRWKRNRALEERIRSFLKGKPTSLCGVPS